MKPFSKHIAIIRHHHHLLYSKVTASVIAAGLIILTAPPVLSDARQLYTTDGVNIRAEADSSSRICTAVSLGTLVTEVGSQGNWIEVKTDDVTGFIYKDFLSEEDPSCSVEVVDEEEVSTEAVPEEKPAAKPEGQDLRQEAISYAQTRLGDKYSQKKRDKEGYADCSSLVRDSYEEVSGIYIGDNTDSQAEMMESYLYPIKSLTEVQAGDIVYHMTKDNHTGIYLGNGRVLHASQTSGNVKITEFAEDSTYWEYGCDAASFCIASK